MSKNQYMTTAEAADVLSCSTATVARLAAAGVLPTAQKLPGKTGANLFNAQDIIALAERRAAEAEAKARAARARLEGVA